MTNLSPYPSHYSTSTAYYGSLTQWYNIFKMLYIMYERLEYQIKRFEARISYRVLLNIDSILSTSESMTYPEILGTIYVLDQLEETAANENTDEK